MQSSIFDEMYDDYKQTKPLRVIEFFAGYGSQLQSLRYLSDFFGKDKINYQHYKICEWALPSIIAYADMHQDELEDYGNDFCGDLTKEQIAKELCFMGVSLDYNEPATYEKLCRVNEDRLRLCFNSIMWTNNLVDISRVKGSELNINDTDKYDYILTYSFPCQSLSLAGKRELMKKGSSTRSGLLWQVERILTELNEIGKNHLPQLLLMENVPQVHGAGAKNDFDDWIRFLEKLGYKCYYDDLIATDYGIPQTRNRTFMISILGDYNYRFPKPVKLKLRLKDLLENNVDKKYYLSEKQIEDIKSWKAYEKPLERMEIIERERVAPTLTTRTSEYTSSIILIKNATKKGYLEATDGDGIDISNRMESHRGTVQKDKAQTITTMGGASVGVVIKETIPNDKVVVLGNYSPSNHNASKIIDKGGYAPTVMENHGTITAIVDTPNKIDESLLLGGYGTKGSTNQYRTQNRIYSSSSSSPTLSTGFNPSYLVDLRIRKLTPKECFRLQGVKDREIDFIMKNQTNSSGYHLAGDSICITVLIAIFGELFKVDWRKCLPSENIKEWWYLC